MYLYRVYKFANCHLVLRSFFIFFRIGKKTFDFYTKISFATMTHSIRYVRKYLFGRYFNRKINCFMEKLYSHSKVLLLLNTKQHGMEKKIHNPTKSSRTSFENA